MNFIHISPEVGEAIAKNRPVLAMESTLIAHGFPYPENIELARLLEKQTRAAGVVPATIAILDGQVRIGLTEEELERIATAPDIIKASLRDIPVLIAKKLSGGTTVATTMQFAEKAGIRTFVTGGIGGVHRGAEESFDESADLQALARYRVVVVCAGAKSVLDLPKTRERLESLGVPVLGYRHDRFPAFYTRDSGMPVDHVIEDPSEIVRIMEAKDALSIPGGVVVTTPVPAEFELDGEEHRTLMDRLVTEAAQTGVSGKDVTPFLLRRLREETSGESVTTNIELIRNNLSVGCEIANAFSAGQGSGQGSNPA